MNYQYFLLKLVNSDIIFSISFEKCLVSHMHDPHSQHSHPVQDSGSWTVPHSKSWRVKIHAKIKSQNSKRKKKTACWMAHTCPGQTKEFFSYFPFPSPLASYCANKYYSLLSSKLSWTLTAAPSGPLAPTGPVGPLMKNAQIHLSKHHEKISTFFNPVNNLSRTATRFILLTLKSD